MAKFGKWIGGGLGWAVGGPIGALLGFAVGSVIDKSISPEEETYQRGRNSGDNVMAAMGALEAALSFAEAVPVTAAAAKGVKKNIPTTAMP